MSSPIYIMHQTLFTYRHSLRYPFEIRQLICYTSGNIIDTCIKVMSDTLGGASKAVTLLVIYLFVTFFNFFVASGSGKAMMMMPIMRPLGEILGINQQVMVLTYQYGDVLVRHGLWQMVQICLEGLCRAAGRSVRSDCNCGQDQLRSLLIRSAPVRTH